MGRYISIFCLCVCGGGGGGDLVKRVEDAMGMICLRINSNI